MISDGYNKVKQLIFIGSIFYSATEKNLHVADWNFYIPSSNQRTTELLVHALFSQSLQHTTSWIHLNGTNFKGGKKSETTTHLIVSIALITFTLCLLSKICLELSMKPAKNFYPFLLKFTTVAKYS